MSSGRMKRDTPHMSLWFLKARYEAAFINVLQLLRFYTLYTASEARFGNRSDQRLQVSFT